ncbi:restriction endonuclease subunit M [Agrobacterium vitis]|uniref:site-specific DNA-methyltransferase n=1 Tax=Agrobacterium vitis TaxID=373 RepID=UPI0015D707F2|nr:site-specific DNA-methyltransferase [Agrobacterium vitis]BCH59001.1 restriction endonuclease subunit M [Agrobacterium vitis]
MNQLWFGDNLTILREEIATESVDLVYLDPPFNSSANYNVLFKTPTDDAASAQVEAFRDTWTWGNEAQWALDEIMHSGGSIATIIHALHTALVESDMMAYLVMMAQRISELRRVLKPTGSIYLHCDPTASHYLKIILDAAFGPKNFRNEISWRRQSAHNDAKQGRKQFGNVRDVILFYTKSNVWKWNTQYTPYDEKYVKDFYKYREPETGRLFRLSDLTGPGGAAKGNPFYEVMGVGRYWRFSKEKMEKLIEDGRVVQLKEGAVPAQKRYLDEMPGVALQNEWSDIKPASGRESLGYPTQKPISLLKRIVGASTDPGDVVLDPFCGCGTTVAAAQVLDREWIGIDVAFHAIKVIEERILEQSPNAKFSVGGIPRDFESAQRLALKDKFQFQWWANYLVGVQALKEVKKGPDRGIDGQMYFMNGPRGWGRVLTSVKGGQHVGAKDVREFKAVVDREKAEMGLFICLNEATREMNAEAASFGFVDTAHGHLPRLQIVTIIEWFKGKRPTLPSLGHVSREFFEPEKNRKPVKIKRPDPNAPEFRFTFPGTKTDENVVVHFNPSAVTKKEPA